METLFDTPDPPKKKTRQDQIFANFVEFFWANLEIWRLFVRFADTVTERGYKKFSARTIIERIRWETNLETKGEPVKINNDYTPYYARLYMLYRKSDLFKLRYLKSIDKKAYKENLTVVGFDEPGDEEKDVLLKLRDLLDKLREKEEAERYPDV